MQFGDQRADNSLCC